MKIITNTASSLNIQEGAQLGINILPVSVSIEGRVLRDYIDISPDEYVKLLRGEEIPSSSQPSIGDIMDLLDDSGEETIMLTVADGLSGEYGSAMAVRNSLQNRDSVYVINSGTLAGPLRYMAAAAARLRDQGESAKEIVRQITALAGSSISYVIPSDFRYLRKSGRISHLTSRIGGALHLLPVLTQTEDRKRISFKTVRRTWKSAVETVLAGLRERGVDEGCLISIAYADQRPLAEKVLKQVRESFPRTECEILQLAPSLITHGGPGCIVIQAIHKI